MILDIEIILELLNAALKFLLKCYIETGTKLNKALTKCKKSKHGPF